MFCIKNVHQACERNKYRVFSASNIKRVFTISHKTPCFGREKQGFRMKNPLNKDLDWFHTCK